MAHADWFGNLFNYVLGIVYTEILGVLFLSWWVPISGIFLNDWTVFYKTFIGFNILLPAVKSAGLSIN